MKGYKVILEDDKVIVNGVPYRFPEVLAKQKTKTVSCNHRKQVIVNGFKLNIAKKQWKKWFLTYKV